MQEIAQEENRIPLPAKASSSLRFLIYGGASLIVVPNPTRPMIAILPTSLPLSTLTSTGKVSPEATAVPAAGLTMDMPLEE